MADLNHVTLIGRLTRDAELKYTPGGLAISSFSIAVNRRRKNGDQWVDEVSYFDINLYGKPAESLKQYLTKGKQVAVDGELRQDRWEKDGQKFSRVSIVANNVQLLGGKSEGGQNQMAGGAPRFQPRQDFSSMPTQSMPDYGDSFGDTGSDFPEDIPF